MDEMKTAPAAEAGAESVNQEPVEGVAPADEAERRAEEYLAQLQRLKADFDNYRRRMMQEQGRWQEQAVGRFLAQLLPVLDNLERALQAGDGAGHEVLRQGLEMTLRQFRDTLAGEGVSAVEAAGRPFDPACHEAMARVEGEGYEEDTVVEEFQKGYLYKGSVLRPALVKVAVAGTRAGGDSPRDGAPDEAAGAGTV